MYNEKLKTNQHLVAVSQLSLLDDQLHLIAHGRAQVVLAIQVIPVELRVVGSLKDLLLRGGYGVEAANFYVILRSFVESFVRHRGVHALEADLGENLVGDELHGDFPSHGDELPRSAHVAGDNP